MSYKALYRKYRPKSFSEVVGQGPIVATLKNIIEGNKISHAYLFSGPRGTGKTSVAHIFARQINKSASGNISDMDILEIDAASNNGVAEIRNIIDRSNYAPSDSKYKVYIIDEVHMLTKGAFNALLKTLEEPPAHLVFILATTEPHKLPVTILSRTQRFNFRRIEDKTIIQQLVQILDEEKISYENDALKFIAKLARGGMRDALSIADQAASYGSNDISFAGISQVFGIISIGNIIKILELIYKGDIKALLATVNQFFDNGADLERITSSLINVLKDFIVYKKTFDKTLLIMTSQEEIAQINIGIEFAYDALEEFVKLLTDLRFSQVPKELFEISLLKLSKNEVVSKPIAVQSETNNNLKDQNLNTIDSIASDSNQPIDHKRKTSVLNPAEKQQINPVEENISSGEIEPNENSGASDDSELDRVLEDVSSNEQMQLETQELENDILSTQELMLDKEMEKKEPTEEIDLVSYFDSEDKKEVETKGPSHNYDIDSLINMFIQADKEKSVDYKNSIESISSYIDDVKDKNYIDIIKQTKFISGGKDFLIVSSENKDIINKIIQVNHNNDFLEFINVIFKKPLLVVAITKENFHAAKSKWMELSQNSLLPNPIPIEKLELLPKEKTEEQKYGEDIFGDLFK